MTTLVYAYRHKTLQKCMKAETNSINQEKNPISSCQEFPLHILVFGAVVSVDAWGAVAHRF